MAESERKRLRQLEKEHGELTFSLHKVYSILEQILPLLGKIESIDSIESIAQDLAEIRDQSRALFKPKDTVYA